MEFDYFFRVPEEDGHTTYAVFANSFDEAREILKNHIGEKTYIFEYILPHINLKSKVTDP